MSSLNGDCDYFKNKLKIEAFAHAIKQDLSLVLLSVASILNRTIVTTNVVIRIL